MITKPYTNREKFRCVMRLYFDPLYEYGREVEFYKDAGFSPDEIIAKIGGPPAALTTEEMIHRGVEFDFSPLRRGRYKPQRFNTATRAAYYTASDEEASRRERRWHWKRARDDAGYVIFTVSFSGTARDIRPEIEAGLPFPDHYAECQAYADAARDRGLDAIAAPSKRSAGSCCAIFHATAIIPGELVFEGSFK